MSAFICCQSCGRPSWVADIERREDIRLECKECRERPKCEACRLDPVDDPETDSCAFCYAEVMKEEQELEATLCR